MNEQLEMFPGKPQGDVFPQETQEATASKEPRQETREERQGHLAFYYCPQCNPR